jgi:RimJ/RimL family protein N-acetyltransferase
MAQLDDFQSNHFNFIKFKDDKDHEKFTKKFRDPEAKKYSKDMFYQGFKLVKNNRVPYDHNYFIVQDKQSGDYIGAVYVSSLTNDNTRGLSYAIDKDHRGQNFGSIMVAESILHLWETGTENIDIFVRNDNESSIGLAKKLGFKIAQKSEDKKDTSKYILKKTIENQELLENIIQQSKLQTTEISQESENQLRQSISPKALKEASKTRFKDFCRQKFTAIASMLKSRALNNQVQEKDDKTNER